MERKRAPASFSTFITLSAPNPFPPSLPSGEAGGESRDGKGESGGSLIL